MGFFDKLFGKKQAATSPPSTAAQAKQETPSAKPDPASDPDLIKIYDDYGREMYISKDEWRSKILPDNLEKHRDDPDQLYSVLIGALEDGFAADVVDYAEHLKETDPMPSRGASLLAIVYTKVDRLDDAQRVLEEHIGSHGEDGVVLTNLAKVYSFQGDEARAESVLWHALELDPNQDNGLAWYAAVQRERGGEAAELEAFRKVAALPGSWRARLWLARDAVNRKDVAAAETLYREALTLAGEPAPADLLMQMSGDLGNGGYLEVISRLVAPRFNPEYHGLSVGNNLIKANLDLGRLDEAREVLGRLYALKRADYRQTLNYWETELAKLETARRGEEPEKQVSIVMLNIQGPLWMRDASPFASLMEAKKERTTKIAIFGSTVLMDQAPETNSLQLSDAAGRLSRAVPMMISEILHLTTDAVGVALIPWAQGKGFALFGHEYEDSAICEMTGGGEDAPDYVIGVTVDAREAGWSVNVRMMRRANATRVAESSIDVNLDDLGALIVSLSGQLDTMLSLYTGVKLTDPPAWYQLPSGPDGSNYLLRLEQQLSVACSNLDFVEGSVLFGEREMLDGVLQLCRNHPKNPTVRMLAAQTMRLMKKARPEIVPEFQENAEKLQRQYPLGEPVDGLVEKAFQEAFTG